MTKPEQYDDLINDLPLWNRREFLRDLKEVQQGDAPSRDEVLALRIACEEDYFGHSAGCGRCRYDTVLTLVQRGLLDEMAIARCELAR
ncbi:MAG: hypothetical protein QM655_12660 [Nocardioidaceae bacterium]